MRVEVATIFLVMLISVFPSSRADEKTVTVTGKYDLGEINEKLAMKLAHEQARLRALEEGGLKVIRRDTKMKNFELVKDVIVAKTEGIITDEEFIAKGIKQNRYAWYKIRATVNSGQLEATEAKLLAALQSRGMPKIGIRIFRNKPSYVDSAEDSGSYADEDVSNLDYSEEIISSSGKSVQKKVSSEVKCSIREGKDAEEEQYRSEAEKIIRAKLSSFMHKHGFTFYDEEKLKQGRKNEGNYFKTIGNNSGSKIQSFGEIDYVITGSVFISKPIYFEEEIEGEAHHLVKYSYNISFDYTNVATGEQIPGFLYPDDGKDITVTKPAGENFAAIKADLQVASNYLTEKILSEIIYSWCNRKPLIRVNFVNITDDEFYALYDEFVDKFSEVTDEKIEDNITDYFNNGEGSLEISTDLTLNTIRRFFRKQKVVKLEMIHKDNNTLSFAKE